MINTHMPHYIYRTTNLVNHKIYIGVTNKNKGGYLGSGTHLKKAIERYGRENFKREILEQFDTEAEAFQREAESVDNEFVKDPMNYNIKTGGKGGAGQLKTAEHREHIKNSIKQMYATGTLSRNGGRPAMMDRTFLYDMVSQYGFRGAATKLDLTYWQVRSRYYRFRDKDKASQS